jgi:sugar phosphate isomerase/epimerase
MCMKMAYGTYAMPTVPLEEALPALAHMGYDGVEVCVGPKHMGAMPEEMDGPRRRRLRALLEGHGLGVPALFSLGHIFTESDDEHRATLEHLRACAGLARDLGIRQPPVLAIGIGGRRDDWGAIRHKLVDLLGDYAKLAEDEDVIIAGEAHCGAAVDRSERITWLLDTVNHPRIRLHFDIVHLYLAGEAIEEAVRTLVPYTAHTHITDARKHPDGSFDLLLLGDGELDSVAYLRAMREAGWDDFITLEVSMRVWSKPEYDPMAAAERCYAVLDRAFREAGVARG